MRFCVLGSGSKGNATYVSAGDTAILIDAGFSGVEMQRRLAAIGVDFSTISAIFLTHEHHDHIKGAPVLSRRGKVPVFANPATFTAAAEELNNLHQYNEFDTGVSFQFRDLKIHPFSVSHDTADPVGFTISDGRDTLGYCTDTGMITRLMHHHLANCRALILESNHDPEILKNGPYPPFLKQRVRGNKGHLANGDAAAFIRDLRHDDLRHVILAHISETNNCPNLAYETTMRVLNDHNCRSLGVSVARQDRAGDMVELR